MKKVFFLLLSITMLWTSCSNDNFSGQGPVFLKFSTQPTTWQRQLEYAKKNSSGIVTRTDGNIDRISFLGYTYKGKIDTKVELNRIIEKMFSEDAVTVVYEDTLNFDIVSMKEIIHKAKMIGVNDPFANVKAQVEASVRVGMELIDLEWCYKDEIYKSMAIASNEHGGIIYDNIGYLILEPINAEIERDVNWNMPMIKTRNESGVGPAERKFSHSDSGRNYFGMTVWTYDISCNSYFNKDGILYDRQMDSSQNSAIGWYCSADIRTLNGIINDSKYHEFAWGCIYGSGSSMSLTWGMAGFSLPGGCTGQTGTQVHRP